ncbi:hypothetical protein ACWEN3_43585 [Streptomyces sp. NPDC004561]
MTVRLLALYETPADPKGRATAADAAVLEELAPVRSMIVTLGEDVP